jgi:hypothetical protein
LEDNVEVAVKSFLPVDSNSGKAIERDLKVGTDPRLISEYTLIYEDSFEFEGLLCVTMPLMKISLENYIQKRKILSDEVFEIIIYFTYNYRMFC